MSDINRLFDLIRVDNVVCQDGLGWLENCETLKDIWDKCPRADWMILNAGRMGYEGQVGLRKFMHRIITEVPYFKGRTILEHASNEGERGAIMTLGSFVIGEKTLQDVNDDGLKVWQKRGHDHDITTIIATSCMWGSEKGAIMAAKAVLGRMNAIADDEAKMEKESADILRKCISYESVYEVYKEYTKE
jgi:hypothetical protein